LHIRFTRQFRKRPNKWLAKRIANLKFTLGDLSLDRYRLELSGQGFVTQSLLVDVQSNNPISRTITMALGVESARVDVVVATPLAGSNLSLQEMPGQSRLRLDRT
jgi:hypothetical protein